MLLIKGFVKTVAWNLHLFNKFGSYLYNMDHSTYNLTTNESKVFKFEMLCQCVLSTLIATTLFLQTLLYQDKFPSIEIFESVFNTGAILTFLVSFYVYFTKRSQIVELFNMILHFERKLLHGILLTIFLLI